MPTLANYHHFAGRHWETGSIHNYYAYRGVNAPHTGQPYSEALLLGISGGVTVGYFSFAYDGYAPHVALLTRNSFDPLNTLLARLGVVQEVQQTSKRFCCPTPLRLWARHGAYWHSAVTCSPHRGRSSDRDPVDR